MNSIFRNIRENRDLDLAEESDDESFFDTSEHKFVELRKKYVMPFCYLSKFNKWAPLLTPDGEKLFSSHSIPGGGSCPPVFN